MGTLYTQFSFLLRCVPLRAHVPYIGYKERRFSRLLWWTALHQISIP